MATRTIYLSDEQLKTYQKAQTIAGERNMSNFVIQSLKHYMNIEHINNDEGYIPYTLFLGITGEMEKVMFKGLFLSAAQTAGENKTFDHRIYLTRKEHILFYENVYDELERVEKATYQTFEKIEDLIKSKATILPKELVIKAKEKLNIIESVQLDV